MLASIRVSVGTAAVLKLLHCKQDALPTTAYTMIYSPKRCTANCAFCAQARQSTAKANRLSRIAWPDFPVSKFIDGYKANQHELPFQRICIQTIYYTQLIEDLGNLVQTFRSFLPQLPLSLALPPLTRHQFQYLYDLGVERVAVALDAATHELFHNIKGPGVNGPFSWDKHNHALETALSIFGRYRTTTHLIIGLGETEFQTINLLQDLTDKGINVGLFPFTPITGTVLEHRPRPSLTQYRRIQIAYYLIRNRISSGSQMEFNRSRRQLTGFGISNELLDEIISRETVFQTTGCPSCNRPFFTEEPRGPLYNYPQAPSASALNEIRNQLGGIH